MALISSDLLIPFREKFIFTLFSLVKCVSHIGSDSFCYFYFFQTTFFLIQHIPILSDPPSFFARHPISILFGLSLSVTLSFSLSHFTYGFFFYLNFFFFPFRVARFLFHSLFCVGLELPSIHDWMWRSGVSGALKGPSFQNHRSQRTHQTAYAKRKSRRRSVGNLIGEFSVDSHLLPLYLFRSRYQNCISLIRSAKKKIQSSKTKENHDFQSFQAKRHDLLPFVWKSFYLFYCSRG